MTDFINKSSGVDLGYFEILDLIEAPLLEPTEKVFDALDYGKKLGMPFPRSYWIRHDVDNHINLAWDMAKAESERGIRAAYFFLNTAPYFRWGAFLDMAKDFVDIGHTIGLHNNAVTLAYKNGDPKLADRIMRRDLSYLRRAGDVFITASHGDIWNRHYNVMNYEMFTECRRNGSFPHKPLAEYGLKYETYFTPRSFYLSDSGGVWSRERDINVAPLMTEIPKGENPADTIEAFNQSENGIMQLLIHPEWWEAR